MSKMTKQEIIDSLNNIQGVLPKEKYDIVYNAALVFHGILREAGCIHLNVSRELFNDLVQKGYYSEELGIHEPRVIYFGNGIQVFHDRLTIPEYSIDHIDGFRVMKVGDIASEFSARWWSDDRRNLNLVTAWLETHKDRDKE